MKRTLMALVGGAILAWSAGTAQAAGQLNIYNWFDYIPQELLDKHYLRKHGANAYYGQSKELDQESSL